MEVAEEDAVVTTMTIDGYTDNGDWDGEIKYEESLDRGP